MTADRIAVHSPHATQLDEDPYDRVEPVTINGFVTGIAPSQRESECLAAMQWAHFQLRRALGCRDE